MNDELTKKTDQRDNNEGSYASKREELLEIVGRLERNTGEIEDLLKMWDKANELTIWCKNFLENAKKKVGAVKEESL